MDFKTDVETDFTGYDELETDTQVLDLIEREGKHYVIVDKCPLYAEKGGQVSDKGLLIIDGQSISVNGVMQVGAAFCLEIDKPIDSWNGQPIKARACVDSDHRKKIEAHHTATHLMHQALRSILGSHVEQKGSLVNDEYLRFDFSHFSKVTNEELAEEVRQRGAECNCRS